MCCSITCHQLVPVLWTAKRKRDLRKDRLVSGFTVTPALTFNAFPWKQSEQQAFHCLSRTCSLTWAFPGVSRWKPILTRSKTLLKSRWGTEDKPRATSWGCCSSSPPQKAEDKLISATFSSCRGCGAELSSPMWPRPYQQHHFPPTNPDPRLIRNN